ncbi:MAG: YbjN domain-containing protein [Treponema sp.]|nr:YbjN domain-containing protein [Treponema sp.]
MKKLGKIFFTILIFGLFIVFPAAAQKTKSDFQKMYMDFLKKKGYNTTILEDGDIRFVIEGSGFFIVVNEKEPQNFQIYTFMSLENRSKQITLAAANNTNGKSYGTKVWISDDGTHAVFIIENILLKPKDFQQIFDKALASIVESIYYFLAEIK